METKSNISLLGFRRRMMQAMASKSELPQGYFPCEYIESDGTNYIDTGVSPDGNTRITAGIQLLNLTNADFGTSPTLFGASSSSSARYALYWSHTGRRFGTYYAGESHDFNDTTDGYARISVDYNGNIHTLNGESYTYEPSTVECVDTIYLFGNNTAGTAWFLTLMRLYSCQIYDNGILVRDYIPCMNANNVYGLYDKVNGVFYTSATDSGFTGKLAEDKKPDYTILDAHGVAIMDIKGRFYPDAASWRAAGSPTPNGVAVSDGVHRFCVATKVINKICNTAGFADAEYWGAYNKQVSGVTTTSINSVAKQDFNGMANTDAIVANVTTSDGFFTKSPWSAAGLCRQFTFPNGAKGYLGSCGEWGLVQNEVNKINEFMDELGGAMIAIGSTIQPIYWTSTQYSSTYAWYYELYSNTINGANKYSNGVRVRAFCTLDKP